MKFEIGQKVFTIDKGTTCFSIETRIIEGALIRKEGIVYLTHRLKKDDSILPSINERIPEGRLFKSPDDLLEEIKLCLEKLKD